MCPKLRMRSCLCKR